MDAQRRTPPNEVLIQIFELLPYETIYQCIFICKSWSFATIQTYYKDLHLSGETIKFLQMVLSMKGKKKKDSIMTVGQNGEYVKSLTLYDDLKKVERFSSKEQLIKLFSNMPHLKKIDISSSKNAMYYLKQLWNIIKNPNSKDVIKRVQEVYVSAIYHIVKPQYFQVCYALRDTLTHLSLVRLKQVYRDVGICRYYFSLLPRFKNLTHLHIKNKTYHYRGHWGRQTISEDAEADLSIQSVLDACKKLTHLSLESDAPIIHDIMVDKSAFDMVLLRATGARSRSLFFYSSDKRVKQQQDIYNDYSAGMKKKVLFLQVPNLSVKNLMQYISPQVSTLNLLLQQNFDIWIQDCEEGNDTLIQDLDRKCCTIKDLTISIGGKSDWLTTTEEKNKLRQITLEDRFMAFQKFVDMIGRTQDNLLCTLYLDLYNDDEDTSGGHKFALIIKNGVMNVKYAFRLKENGYMVLPSFLGLMATTDKKMQLSSKIYSISVNFKKVSVDENRMELQDVMNQILANLITNYERLAYMSINCVHYYGVDAEYKLSSELYDSVQNGGVIPARYYQDFVDRPKCKDALSRFFMKGLEVSPEVLDVLNNSLNDVRSVILQGCIFNKNSNDNVALNLSSVQHLGTLSMDPCIFDKDSNNNVTLDLSSIPHIGALVLDVKTLKLSSHSNAFFLIEYINKNGEDKTVYYQCHEKNSAYNKRLSLVPTTFKYIHSRNRFYSKNSVVCTIKLSEIDTFSIYHSCNPKDSTARIKFNYQH